MHCVHWPSVVLWVSCNPERALMLPAGPNSAKPRSFLGYEGDDGTHGYFRLERLALAWPHAGEQ